MTLATTATPCHAQASHPPTLAPRGAGSLVGATGAAITIALLLALLSVMLIRGLGLGIGLAVTNPAAYLDAGVDAAGGGAP